jgi:uncharacterized membrane protein
MPAPPDPTSSALPAPILRARLSGLGLLVGSVFFAISLTPSLVPRPSLVQGLLAGVSLAAGYGIGVAVLWLWRYLELPVAEGRLEKGLKLGLGMACALVVASFLWQAATWQDSIHAIMGIDEGVGVRPTVVGATAAGVFVVLLLVARLFRRTFRFLSKRLRQQIPPRVSNLVGIAISVMLFWSVVDGVLVSFVLRTSDRSFQQLDALIEDDLPRPARAYQTGSEASLLAWEGLGRQGRAFVAGGPDAETLSRFFGRPVPPPLRVYAGLNSADTPAERARLAVEELKRVGGFERSILLLVTPTGTGWVDPASQDVVEYLHRGDVATVAAQYSYLSSPLALLTEAAYGAETARALFTEVYDHWRTLPRDARPRLFLYGLSLGALNSDLSFDLFDIIDDPFDGVLWVGAPFRTETWRRVTAQRDAGSPAWLPRFGGGAVVRVMNQDGGLEAAPLPWGEFRMAFLQYASDPIVFFDPNAAWREPAWMEEPRGPDVSPDLRWFPVVTMLQLAADMVVGTAPPGFGHEYAPEDYLEAWRALTEPEGWSRAELERLLRVVKGEEEVEALALPTPDPDLDDADANAGADADAPEDGRAPPREA